MRITTLAIISIIGLLTLCIPPESNGARRTNRPLPPVVIEQQPFNVILGCPEDTRITLNLLSLRGGTAFIEYGKTAGESMQRTTEYSLQPDTPLEVIVEPLSENTEYSYRIHYRENGHTKFSPRNWQRFHTKRSRGSTFTFALQGDSHPERVGRMYDPDLYVRTLNNAKSHNPDFYLLLGDDFSIDPLINRNRLSQENVNRVYRNQRNFLSLLAGSSPLFLVNGNHEQAARYLLDGASNNAAVMAAKARNTFFSQPAPNSFYKGDTEEVQFIGLLRDYYAWHWGDALFVVIDPYWHSPVSVDSQPGGKKRAKKVKAKRDLWAVTIGDAQYQWLKNTLEQSTAKFKFVFAHHVLGTGRGGVEMATGFEWGSTHQLSSKRPGWEMTIHELMVHNGVTIFFQGHDHLFAHQELDGIVYQTVPNPADPTYQAFNSHAYRTGKILPNSGHIQVTVSQRKVTVEYIRAYLPADETGEQQNGLPAYRYLIHSASPH